MADLQPYLPYIIMAVNGLLAGWLAGLLLGGGGLIRNLFVGIIGSFVGAFLLKAELFKLPFTTGFEFGDQIVVSTLGAILVILVARLIAR